MTRIFPCRSVWITQITSTPPRRPKLFSRTSPVLSSGPVRTGPLKIEAASSKDSPCFRRFAMFFSGSHSNPCMDAPPPEAFIICSKPRVVQHHSRHLQAPLSGLLQRLFGDALGVEFKQLFQPFGVVAKAAADVDALKHLVVAVMGFAQVGGHRLGVVEISDCRGKMRLACQQNVFGAVGQVSSVLLGERRNGEGIPAKCRRVAEISFKSATHSGNPNSVKSGCDDRQLTYRRRIDRKCRVGYYGICHK